ncbi:hypothetical protein LCGC14_2594050 [marine sediment metagenome]|uniref:Uncharacterized protein n=1 Tax=marine sediment metagenome TaxID=412755 RepID=A0A0F9D3E3_9ZZZZ
METSPQARFMPRLFEPGGEVVRLIFGGFFDLTA